jgi:hypothetical protein
MCSTSSEFRVSRCKNAERVSGLDPLNPQSSAPQKVIRSWAPHRCFCPRATAFRMGRKKSTVPRCATCESTPLISENIPDTAGRARTEAPSAGHPRRC